MIQASLYGLIEESHKLKSHIVDMATKDPNDEDRENESYRLIQNSIKNSRKYLESIEKICLPKNMQGVKNVNGV